MDCEHSKKDTIGGICLACVSQGRLKYKMTTNDDRGFSEEEPEIFQQLREQRLISQWQRQEQFATAGAYIALFVFLSLFLVGISWLLGH